MESLIYENPDIDLNDSAIQLALDIDRNWDLGFTFKKMVRVGDYLMDARDHTIVECTNNYAFNYLCPVLIECGFHVKHDLLKRAIDAKALPSEELAYYKQIGRAHV